MGCEDMSAPQVYDKLKDMDGCAQYFKKKMFFYQDGHTHCNEVQTKNEATGFMIGAHGMGGCSQFGFEIIDSTGGSLKLDYYEVNNNKGTDNFAALMECSKNGGFSENCGHLKKQWLNAKI